MDKRTQYQRVLDYLEAGELMSSLGAARLSRPIMDLPKRVSELRRDGYQVESIKKGRATYYYMPDKVDNRELAAWASEPLIRAV